MASFSSTCLWRCRRSDLDAVTAGERLAIISANNIHNPAHEEELGFLCGLHKTAAYRTKLGDEGVVKSISRFSLEGVPVYGSGQALESKLYSDGVPTGRVVPGVRLEAQFQCRPGYLLLTTEDNPYEEELHLILMDPMYEIVDALRLSVPYAPGLLTDLHVRSEGEIEFSFFGKDRWLLAVAETPKRNLCGRRAPGVHSNGSLVARRYLSLKRVMEDVSFD